MGELQLRNVKPATRGYTSGPVILSNAAAAPETEIRNPGRNAASHHAFSYIARRFAGRSAAVVVRRRKAYGDRLRWRGAIDHFYSPDDFARGPDIEDKLSRHRRDVHERSSLPQQLFANFTPPPPGC
jgi:hypothetical protein